MLAETLVSAGGGALGGISPGIYSAADFDAISRIVYRGSGIVLTPSKSMLVYSRLAPLVRDTGSATFSTYVERIGRDAAERTRAIEALTTNHTFFYREAHHFEHFSGTVRPDLVRQALSGQPVRLWSAGCSSGEETWSLVLTLLGADRGEGRRIAQSDTRVLATDLASQVLARASAARYPRAEMEAIPAALRQAWAAAAGEDAEIAAEARELVRFRLLNLLEEWPLNRPFDVIFCRNVMIYFDQPTKDRLLARLVDQLVPGGFLYIGHSERATGPAEALLTQVGPTIYQRSAA